MEHFTQATVTDFMLIASNYTTYSACVFEVTVYQNLAQNDTNPELFPLDINFHVYNMLQLFFLLLNNLILLI